MRIKQNFKKSKFDNCRLVLFLIFITQLAWNSLAFSQAHQLQCTEPDQSSSNDQMTHKPMWDRYTTSFKQTLKKINLSFQLNTPSSILAQGFDPSVSYKFTSRDSIGGKFSGIDRWRVGLGLSSELFGWKLPLVFSAEAEKEITFIRQFESRGESLARLPYNPLKRIPVTTDTFFQVDDNGEPLFKTLDFMSIQIPMTLKVGRKFAQRLVKEGIDFDSSVDYYLSGEFNLQIFRMSDNLVRLKIYEIKDKGFEASADLALLAIAPIPSAANFILTRILGVRLFDVFWTKKKTHALLADYVFDISKPNSKDLYNKIFGSKLSLTSTHVIKNRIAGFSPVSDENKSGQLIFSDLLAIEELCFNEKNKEDSHKSVHCINEVDLTQKSSGVGIRFQFLRAAKFRAGLNHNEATMTVTVDDTSTRLALESDESYFSYNLLGVVGKSKNKLAGTLVNSLNQEIVGSFFSNYKTFRSFSEKDLKKLIKDLKQFLPEAMFNVVNLPQWNIACRKNQEVINVNVREDLFIKREAFNLNLPISKAETSKIVSSVFESYIETFGRPNSVPAGVNMNDHFMSPKKLDYDKGFFKDAFKDDLSSIALSLQEVFGSAKPLKDKTDIINKLSDDIPLFKELSLFLYLQFIPKDQISNLVLGQFIISGKGVTPESTLFPSAQDFGVYNAIREIVDRSTFINTRQLDLKYFISADGKPFTLEQVKGNNEIIQ